MKEKVNLLKLSQEEQQKVLGGSGRCPCSCGNKPWNEKVWVKQEPKGL